MIDLVQVTSFSPTTIASGGTITVTLQYSADDPGFIVVNEGTNFDCVPGQIDVVAGSGMTKTVALQVIRQPNATNRECPIMFTLGAASYTILVGIR